MGNDARIHQLTDDAIRQVASPFAGAAGEQHDVARRQRRLQSRAQLGQIVAHDPELDWLAAQLAHGIGDDPGVGVIDHPRLHRHAGRNDLVAGRKNRHPRPTDDSHDLAMPTAASTPVSRLVSSSPACNTSSPAEMSVPAKAMFAPGEHGPADNQLVVVRVGMLDHHDRVRPARDHAAGRNRHGLAWLDDRLRHDRGGDALRQQDQPPRLLARSPRTCRPPAPHSHRHSTGRTTAHRRASGHSPPTRGPRLLPARSAPQAAATGRAQPRNRRSAWSRSITSRNWDWEDMWE